MGGTQGRIWRRTSPLTSGTTLQVPGRTGTGINPTPPLPAVLEHSMDWWTFRRETERLFYKLLMVDNMDELLPIVYMPTEGEAPGSIFRQPHGLYISLKGKGRVLEILRNWPEKNIQVIGVTDGEHNLGLGDLGCQDNTISVPDGDGRITGPDAFKLFGMHVQALPSPAPTSNRSGLWRTPDGRGTWVSTNSSQQCRICRALLPEQKPPPSCGRTATNQTLLPTVGRTTSTACTSRKNTSSQQAW